VPAGAVLMENTEKSFSTTIANCLNELIINEHVEEALQKIMPWLGEGVQADACFISRLITGKADKRKYIQVKFSWYHQYIASLQNDHRLLQDVLIETYPEVKDCVIERRTISVSLDGQISDSSKKLLTDAELYSLLLVPIISMGECWGIISLSFKSYIAKGVEKNVQLLANAIGASLESATLKNQLYHRNELFETSLATLNELIWELDLRSNRIRIMGFAPRIGTFEQRQMAFDPKRFFNERVHPDDRDTVVRNFNLLLQQGNNSFAEQVCRIRPQHSNEYVWIKNRCTLLCDDDNTPAIIVGSTADITDDKQVAFELQKEKEHNAFLVQNISQIIFKVDANQRWEFLNSAWKAELGYDIEETVGRPILDFIPEAQHETVLSNCGALFQNLKSTCDLQVQFVHKDGHLVWLHLIAKTIKDEENNVTGVFGSMENIQAKYEAERVLQESNERLNTILNSSKEIILTIDLESAQIENVNEAIRILGYTPDEWIGQYYKKWAIDKKKRFHDLLKHASESDNTVRSQQIFFQNKSNTELIPFEFSTSVYYFKQRKYLLCVLRDIRERLEYEKSIHKITEQLTHLISNIDDVYAIFNLKENQYEFVSDNVEGFFGCDKEEFGKHGLIWQEIIHIEDAANIKQQMQDVIRTKTRGEFFYRVTTPMGETKMLLEKITVSADEQGNADKVYIVKTDYTHIENAEQSLIESERRFRFISENVGDFIAIMDVKGCYLYASPSAEKVIGHPAEELLGKSCISFMHTDDVQTFQEQAFRKAITEKQEAQVRYRVLLKDFTYRWVETYCKPIIDVHEETVSVISSTRDVTDQENLMIELEQSLAKERELNHLRSMFVSTASHQFRTPLTVIQTGIEIMDMYLEDLPKEKQQPFQKQFNRIQGEVMRLEDLMNDVLLLGRADARRTPFHPVPKNLVEFCRELIEKEYNNRYPPDRSIQLTVSGNQKEVMFDPKLLHHALDNILSNAYKYSQSGHIEIHLGFEYETVTISITDYGIGIPEADLSNLFQPFYRAGNTSEIEGTGLGLSIVKEFIDKHSGQIFVISEVNKGTTVQVVLPLRQQ